MSFHTCMDFHGSSAGKESTCKAGDSGLNPGLGRTPGEGVGQPLWYAWASLVSQRIKNPPGQLHLAVQSCPALCHPVDCTHQALHLWGFSRREKWSAEPVAFSRETSWPRIQTRVSCIAGGFFTSWATREAPHVRECVLKNIFITLITIKLYNFDKYYANVSSLMICQSPVKSTPPCFKTHLGFTCMFFTLITLLVLSLGTWFCIVHVNINV